MKDFIKEIDKNLIKKLSKEYDYIIYNTSNKKIEVIETIEKGYKWKNNEIVIYNLDEYKKRLKSDDFIESTISEIPRITNLSKYLIPIFKNLKENEEEKTIKEIYNVINGFNYATGLYEEFVSYFKYYRINQKIALEEIIRVLNKNFKTSTYRDVIEYIKPIFDKKEFKYYELKANYGLDSYLKISPSIIYEILIDKKVPIQNNSILEMDAKKRYSHIVSRLKFPVLYVKEKKEKKEVKIEDIIKKQEKFIVIEKKEKGNQDKIDKIMDEDSINLF